MTRAVCRANRIEVAAMAIYKRRFPSAPVNEHFALYHDSEENPQSCVYYSNVAIAILDATAAFDALYPPETKT